MNFLQRASILALGFVSLASSGLACAESDTDSDYLEMGEHSPYSEPLAGGTSGGTNGLSGLNFQYYEYALRMATTQALGTGGSSVITNPYVLQNLLSTPEGTKVFRYAVGCALYARSSVTHGNVNYRGEGHLLTTRSWVTAPLSAAARNDLLACMVAHVNPLGLEVPIVLSGASVADDGGDHSAFDVEEALWTVEEYLGAGAPVRLYKVWPLPAFEQACGNNALSALEDRVCGHDAASCGLIGRTDRATACVAGADGHYFCEGKPAIKTTLSSAGFTALYAAGVCAHD